MSSDTTGALPRPSRRRARRRLGLLLLLLVALPLLASACVFGRMNGVPWYEARRDATGLAPDPATTPAAVAAYPYPQSYRAWPGPNSNTFTAFIARAVPELRLDLPSNAIGKDYLPNGSVFAAAPSGTGYQLSLFGLAGVLAAREEGLELNLLGLTFGLDLASPGIKLPGIGRLGLPSAPQEPAQAAAGAPHAKVMW